MPTYRVSGADGRTGEDTTFEVTAYDDVEARIKANEAGLMVSRVDRVGEDGGVESVEIEGLTLRGKRRRGKRGLAGLREAMQPLEREEPPPVPTGREAQPVYIVHVRRPHYMTKNSVTEIAVGVCLGLILYSVVGVIVSLLIWALLLGGLFEATRSSTG